VADYSVGIQIWIAKKFNVDFSPATIRATVEYIAYHSRAHSNAARDYMFQCPSPQGPRESDYWQSGRKGPGPAFKRLCTEVLRLDASLHVDYDEQTRLAYEGFLWFWLQGAAARACVPACKMEIVLNLFGGQGIGKSTFFRDLCPNPDWFTDSVQDSIVASGRDNKDELSKLHAKMIVEMPELSPVKRGGKAADDKMKQFISAQVDNYRRAYGQDVVSHPRTCALCGTSNNNDVYRDTTGARRFVSIDHGQTSILVGDLDRGVMAEIRDQLWGEIVSSFQPGELDKPANTLLVAIPQKLRDAQSKVNDAHRFEEIGLVDVIEWMADKTRITWSEIIEYAKSIPGLRDAKESMIMVMVRQQLNNEDLFQFKRRVTRSTSTGGTEKANCWVNMNLDSEKNHKAGLPVPKHWSEAALKSSEY
jgi:Virulence-associated protein E